MGALCQSVLVDEYWLLTHLNTLKFLGTNSIKFTETFVNTIWVQRMENNAVTVLHKLTVYFSDIVEGSLKMLGQVSMSLSSKVLSSYFRSLVLFARTLVHTCDIVFNQDCTLICLSINVMVCVEYLGQ